MLLEECDHHFGRRGAFFLGGRRAAFGRRGTFFLLLAEGLDLAGELGAGALQLADEAAGDWRQAEVSLLSQPGELALIRRMLQLPKPSERVWP